MRSMAVRRRRVIGGVAIFAGMLFGFLGFMALAQAPSEPSAPVASLIGTTVFSIEGGEIGTLSAVSVGGDGRITEIRVTTASRLGLGERTIAIEQGSFMLLRGAVVLDLSAEEIDALPSPTVLRGAPA